MSDDPHPATTQPGHDARTPTEFGRKAMWQVLRRVAQRNGRDRVGLVAAGVAFYALLAVFPAIAALVAIVGLVVEPATIAAQLEGALATLPSAAREILIEEVRDVASGAPSRLNIAVLAGIVVALYSASRGVANLIMGLNVAYEEDEARGFVGLTALTLALTFLLLVVIGIALGVVAVLPAIFALMGDQPGLENLADLLRWPILLVVGATAFMLLYRFGPSRRASRWRWLAPGAILACALWIIGTAGFGWYVENLGSYSETFGALAGVIVLMLWLWLSAYAVLIGAVIDAEMEHQTIKDSTRGPDRPLGERGAVKADTYPADDAAG